MRRATLAGFGAALSVLAATESHAQKPRTATLVATVAVEGSQQLLPGAEVIITDLQRAAKSDVVGEADISDVPRGEHLVRVRSFGYIAVETRLVFRGDTLAATFFLKPLAVSMDIVHVSATEVPRGLEQFAARRAMGIGHFLTAGQIDSASTTDFQTLMSIKFPGLTVIPLANGDRVIASLRGGSGNWSVQPCIVPVILDGQPLTQHDAVTDVVKTRDLTGIEFYSGIEVPVEYHVSGYGCGVLVLWSRRI